jgi:hypothetical protein
MKKFDVARSVQVVANVGVLIGILLLVYELNQNRQMMQAQTRSNVASGITDFLVTLGSDPDLSIVWALGTSGKDLDETQGVQFVNLMTGFLRYLEDAHYQYREGLFNKDEFDVQREQVRRLFALPGYRGYWCNPERITVFSRQFTSEVDTLVSCP